MENLTSVAAEIRQAVSSYLATNPSDGGTSNMDQVMVDIPGKRATTVLKLLQAVGIDGFVSTRFGKKVTYLQFGENRFQGNARTDLVRIALKILQAGGIPASIHYAID